MSVWFGSAGSRWSLSRSGRGARSFWVAIPLVVGIAISLLGWILPSSAQAVPVHLSAPDPSAQPAMQAVTHTGHSAASVPGGMQPMQPAAPASPGAPLPAFGPHTEEPPVKVNLQVDVDDDRDIAVLEAVLGPVEARRGRVTVYVPGVLAERRPALLRGLAARGHEIGVHGWQPGEDLTQMTYDQQLALITQAWEAVQRALGPAAKDTALHFKPQGLHQNADTYQALRSLHARSTTGIFPLDGNLFRCAYCERMGMGRIMHPYDLPDKLVAMPVTEVRVAGEDVPLSGPRALAEGADRSAGGLSLLERAYEERRAIGPMTWVVRPSDVVNGRAHDAFTKFLDHITSAGSSIVPTGVVAIAAGGYIDIQSVLLASAQTCAGASFDILGIFAASTWCPTYFIRAYGQYPSQGGAWQLLGQVSYYPEDPRPPGNYEYAMNVTVPPPPNPQTDITLTVRVVGRACQGAGECWPTADSYESMKEQTIPVLAASDIKVTPTDPETTNEVGLEAVTNAGPDVAPPQVNWTIDPTGSRTRMAGRFFGTNPIPTVRISGNPARYTPDAGTHGMKHVEATVTWNLNGQSCMARAFKDFKLFFGKSADDNGDADPNWFDYWGPDAAVTPLSRSDVIYDPTKGPNSYGAFTPSTDKIQLGGAAADVHYPGGINVPPAARCPGGSFGNVKGIDTAAEVVDHEGRHKTIYHNWDLLGAWRGMTDSDTATHHARPGDDLPDSYETGTAGTNPNNVDSCNLATYKAAEYAQYGDNEFDAIRAGNGKKGTGANDWANPGKQSSTPFAAAAQAQSALPPAASGPAGPNAAYSSFYLAAQGTMAGLTGAYSDAGVDTDGDAKFNQLKLSVGVQVTQTADYNVVAWLRGTTGPDFAWARGGGHLTPGMQTVDLLFDGRLVWGATSDGPYHVSRVELRTGDEDDLVDAADNAYTTAAYHRTDFDPPDISPTGHFADRGVDTDGDGLYNTLQVDVGLDVQRAGSYQVSAELFTAGDELVTNARTGVVVPTGIQTVSLEFSGAEIRHRRASGPYALGYLNVADPAGNRLAFSLSPYTTTTAYPFTAFERSAAELTGVYTDTGVDTNGNGRYEWLRFGAGVSVITAGVYSLAGSLVTADDREITWQSQTYTLTAGSQVLALDFDGRAIGRLGVAGPYRVRGLSLLDSAGGLMSYEPHPVSTTAYAAGAFEGGNTLLGAVLDPAGSPTPARVELVGPLVAQQHTGAAGGYRFDGLPDGQYLLLAYSDLITLTRGAANVQVAGGVSVTQNISLALAGAITGRVVDAAGQPITGTSVYYSGFETPRYTVDAQGRFTIPGLTGLQYTLNLVSDSANWWIFVDGRHVENGTQVDLRVDLGQVVNVEFRRPPAAPVLDLAVRKSLADGVVASNETVVYGLNVRNLGTVPAGTVRLTDTLPAGAAYVSDQRPPNFAPQSTGSQVIWTGTNLIAGANEWLYVTVRLPGGIGTGDRVTNTLQVSGDAPEADYVNNLYRDTRLAGVASRDLVVATWLDNGIPLAGQNLVYAVQVRNDGTASAANVRVTDTLPSGVTFASQDYETGYGFTLVMTGNQVVWSAPSLPPGTSAYFYVTGQIAEGVAAGSTLTNTAQATTTDAETSYANNTAADTKTVLQPTVDLVVDKWTYRGELTAGAILTYTLYVENNGNSGTAHVRLTDTLPAGLTFVSSRSETYFPSYTVNTFTPTLSGQTLAWDLGTVPSGGSGYFYVGARADSNLAAGVVLTNTARVSSDQPDVNPSNNQVNYPLTAQPATRDATIGKSRVGGFPAPDMDLVYQLAYQNMGNNPIENVVVTDTLPDLLSYVSSSGPFTPTVHGQQVVWRLGTLPGSHEPGASGSLYLTAHLAKAAPIGAVLTNTAEIATSSVETDNAPNQDFKLDTVELPMPDFNITKFLVGNSLFRGSEARYRISYQNDSNSPAPATWLTDTLPAGLSFVSSDGPVTPTVIGNQVSWSLGIVPAHDFGTVILTVFVSDSLPLGAVVINTAGITTPFETNPADNTDKDGHFVEEGERNLNLTKYQQGSSAVPGGLVTYSLSYMNFGNASAENVTLTDTLPAGLDFVSSSGAPDPAVGGRNVVWQLGTVGAFFGGDNSSGTITLVARVGASVGIGTHLTNTATIATTDAETDYTDNTASWISTVVDARADLAVIKLATGGLLVPGQEVTYTISLFNSGSGDAADVSLVDILPPSMTFVGSTSSTSFGSSGTEIFTPTVSGNRITWTIGAVASFGFGDFDVAVRIAGGLPPDTIFTNIAQAATTSQESDTANNTYTSTLSISPADAYEPDNTFEEAGLISVDGQAQTHNFHLVGDEDWVKFAATAGMTYTIRTSNLGPQSDTYVELLDTDGTRPLQEDDNGGGGKASQIIWTAGADGVYYVMVRSADYFMSGPGTHYDLSIDAGTPPVQTATYTPTPGTPTPSNTPTPTPSRTATPTPGTPTPSRTPTPTPTPGTPAPSNTPTPTPTPGTPTPSPTPTVTPTIDLPYHVYLPFLARHAR